MSTICISGGAGFIGSSLALRLLSEGHKVRILDNLSPQIHGANPEDSFLFSRIAGRVEFVRGDVRIREDWEKALEGCDSVVHLAAETGTGQSMYLVKRYTEVNVEGTATLLEILAEKRHSVKRLVIASSRAVYGEGKYRCEKDGAVYPDGRQETDMIAGRFEPRCPVCGEFVERVPTDEESALKPASLYGITKLTQEQMTMTIGRAIGLECAGLRFQNVYGPGQSLRNPYTGILAIFTNLLREGKKINIFEDGRESRDFVYIDDAVESILLALNETAAVGSVFNVGTGEPLSVIEIVGCLKELVGGKSEIAISGNFRIGDIRHNVADLSRAREFLGFQPKVAAKDGIRRYAEWVLTQEADSTGYETSLEEMRKKGLFK
jgi:dTDP-L-rhamnose 4-epimerase